MSWHLNSTQSRIEYKFVLFIDGTNHEFNPINRFSKRVYNYKNFRDLNRDFVPNECDLYKF